VKKVIAFLLAAVLLCPAALAEYDMEADDGEVDAAVFEESGVEPAMGPEVSAPSAILIEKETGTVVFEKDADHKMEPASVTKVMTILLIVEAVESGSITLDDTVRVSEYAASMGGSQIFLAEGETMPVRDMLKSIVVSSANDAAVAMAEHLAGSEAAFVQRMNDRAAELGMTNTVFCNCTGLLDQPEHMTTARDISIMSRELIRHDWIKDYTTIWMDTVRDGQFGLSNTNKLVRFYDGATGLKTGFTSRAGYCLSATAEKDGVEYIAVVLGCKSSSDRFESAKALLSYGFAAYTLVSAVPDEPLEPIPVTLGKLDYVQPILTGDEKLLITRAQASSLEKTIQLAESVKAPLSAGDTLGSLTITSGGRLLAEIPIVAAEDVDALTVWDIFTRLLKCCV
jgi:D-alanyl-D-alanine carboxypeptidase (penicillin-binding protein 5/6)